MLYWLRPWSSPTTLPNWVDLLIVFLVVRACYVGYSRGAMTELVHLLGIVLTTALAANAYGWLSQRLAAISSFSVSTLEFVSFVLLFLVGLLLVYRVLYRITAAILRERGIAVVTSVFGVLFGAARGGWLTGLLLMLLLSTAIPYFQASVNERSILGTAMLRSATVSMRTVLDPLPGSEGRRSLVPSAPITLPKMPWFEPEEPPTHPSPKRR